VHVPIKVDYGVRALIDLAMYGEDGRFVRAADTSRRAVIPQPYLAQVFHTMRKSGLVNSTRGPGGGHSLAMSADQIRLSKVVDCLDSSENLMECLDNTSFCVHCPDCAQREVWRSIEDAVFGILDSITIDQLVKETKAKKDLILFKSEISLSI